ncbi:hypothetical protein AMELA_G00019240 [Ameiurus melas]|uniref:Uncharacterized protein n=1 Tax=Ameiurus melas TaxID=219545 RepID=A0A7J6BEV9_AMEME|nr:hypothetical protein AMELA_G00019240 [Ameiurus melas]
MWDKRCGTNQHSFGGLILHQLFILHGVFLVCPNLQLDWSLSYTGSWEAWSLSQRTRGTRWGTRWTHHRAQSHTHSHTTDNLDMQICLQCMSLDWGRKLEYPEETLDVQGEHALCTQGRGGIRTPHRWRCEANVRTSKPPSNNSTILMELLSVFKMNHQTVTLFNP